MGPSARTRAAGAPPGPPGAPSPTARPGWPTSAVQIALAAIAAAALGCQRELDMARAYDQGRAATTIRYVGVRGETRRYPDYGSIDARILRPPSTAPTGKPRSAPRQRP